MHCLNHPIKFCRITETILILFFWTQCIFSETDQLGQFCDNVYASLRSLDSWRHVFIFVIDSSICYLTSRRPHTARQKVNVQVCNVMLSSNSTGTSFPVTSSRTCWRRRQLPRNKLATRPSYEEVSDTPDHLDMSRWSESRQLPRNFIVTTGDTPDFLVIGDFPVTFATGKLRGNWSQWNLSFTAPDELTGYVYELW